MALPNSGNSISLSQINTELGRSSNAQISVNTAEDSGYVAINKCSAKRPKPSNAASFSEWFGYDHSATCIACWTGSNEQSYTFSFGAGGNAIIGTTINLTDQGNFRPKFWFSGLTNGTVTMSYTVFQLDSNKANPFYLGSYESTYGQAQYDDPFIGTTPASGFIYILCYISGSSSQANSGTFKVSVTCPDIKACDTGISLSIEQCMCGDIGWLQTADFTGVFTVKGSAAWFAAGTSTRTVTLTYSVTQPDINAILYLTVRDGSGTTIVNAASVSWGSNQTYAFTFTYSSSPNIYCRLDTNCWC